MSARTQKIQAYAERCLKTIRRGSGENYATHGKDVSKVLSEVTDDDSILSIAILHDILVHPDGADLLRTSPLSADEQTMVERMYKLRRLHIDENTDDLDLVIGSFVEDPRLMLLRMAHRLNDIRHLSRFPKKRKPRSASRNPH